MTHAIYNAMVARRRSLPNSDRSHYFGVRLVVQRQGPDTAVCSLITTSVGGQRMSETRLAFATISIRDTTGRIISPEAALEKALEALRRQA